MGFLMIWEEELQMQDRRLCKRQKSYLKLPE